MMQYKLLGAHIFNLQTISLTHTGARFIYVGSMFFNKEHIYYIENTAIKYVVMTI